MSKKQEIDLSVLDDKQIELLSDNFSISEKEWPSLFSRPNVAQYRALEEMYRPEEGGRMPDMVSVEFANGVGKTTLAIHDIIGWCMGPDYLNVDYYPKNAIDFWNSLAFKRDAGKLPLRIVCSAIDMKEQGSVLAIFKEFFPWAKAKGQDNTGCFKQIDIPHPTIHGIVNHIAVLTFDQEPEKHAGPTLDRIWVNENLPQELFGETNARTRGGGNIVQFATILGHSGYLNELEDGQRFVMRRCKGHIYENCLGEQVTEDMAQEVYDEIGVTLQKNQGLDGQGYATNGCLFVEKIEAMIEGWYKDNPDTVKARKTGKPLEEGSRIFPGFSEEVHVIPDDSFANVPEDWPMVMLVDPHPGRPPAVIWAQILSLDRIGIVDEWPSYNEHGYFDKIKNNRYTVNEQCSIWTEIEADRGYAKRIVARIGDPNAFKAPVENKEELACLWDLYDAQGFTFDIEVNDGFEYGKELVNQHFWYDENVRKRDPHDPLARPRLVVYQKCVNVRRSTLNFTYKQSRDKSAPPSENVDKRFACFCSLLRYLAVWHKDHRFEELRIRESRNDDYDLLQRSRIPQNIRPFEDRSPKRIHGRPVIESYAG